jgi:hypothetical protein
LSGKFLVELPVGEDDNYFMPTTAKKWIRKKPVAQKVRKASPLKTEASGKDRAERKKIGKTLNLAAFMEDFKKDTTSAAYWEQAE